MKCVCRYKLSLFVCSDRIFYFWSSVLLCQMFFFYHAWYSFSLPRRFSVRSKSFYFGGTLLHWILLAFEPWNDPVTSESSGFLWPSPQADPDVGLSWKLPVLFRCTRTRQEVAQCLRAVLLPPAGLAAKSLFEMVEATLVLTVDKCRIINKNQPFYWARRLFVLLLWSCIWSKLSFISTNS